MQHEDDAVLVEYCGRERLAFVTEDKRIRMKDYYVTTIKDSNVTFIEARFRKATAAHKDRVYKKFLESFIELVRHPRPSCVVLAQEGLRFVRLDEAVSRRDARAADD